MVVVGEYDGGEPRPWTPEEDRVLRRARAEGRSWPEVARELARTARSVKGRAKRIRAVEDRPARWGWTAEEDAELSEALARGEVEEYAERSGRPLGGVKVRLRRLGLVERSRSWTPDERSYLHRWYRHRTVGELGREMGRSGSSVSDEIRRMGLEPLLQKRRWTPEEDRTLVRLVEAEGMDGAARALGRTRVAVRNRSARLGVSSRVRDSCLPPLQGPYFPSEMRPNRRWSLEDDAVLVRLMEAAWTLQDAAAELGRTREAVRYRARVVLGVRNRRGLGGPAHEGPLVYWSEQHLELLGRWLGSMSHHEIAWRLGRTPIGVQTRASVLRDLSPSAPPRAKG